MEIQYDLRKVHEYQDLYGKNGTLLAWAEDIIMATAPVGIPSITYKNYLEFWARTELLYWNSEALTTDCTPGRVKKLIGLKTNTPLLSKTSFLDFLIGVHLDGTTGEAFRLSRLSRISTGEELRPQPGAQSPSASGDRPGAG